MQFGALYLVVLMAVVPLLAAFYVWGFRRRRAALAIFVELDLVSRLVGSFSWRHRTIKAGCLIAAVGFLVFALMEPQWGRELGDTSRRGRDIFILLDVSRSMLAEDASPSRLESAKSAVIDFAEQLRGTGGHRLGLVIFAGRAMLQGPLTLDYGFFLNRLVQISPDLIDKQGSSIGGAIRKTLYGFGEIDATYTDIIVFTDGEEHTAPALEAAREAAAEGVGLYFVGVGDPDAGARIPIDIGDGKRQFLRHDGQEVVTVLRESPLRHMARLAGGDYLAGRTGPINLWPMFEEHIADKAQRELETGEGEHLADQYAWFVVLALALLIAEMVISERPPRSEEAAS